MTSPLQPAGVQAVVVNLNGFLTGLGQMNAGMQKTGNIAVNVSQQMNVLGGTANTLGTAVAGAATGGFGILGSVIGGILGADLIRKFASGLRDVLSVAGEAAVELQVLTIRLDNLIARQVRASDESISYADSMKKASGHTQELLNWVKELALTTPFSIDTISQTASFALAMGWGIKPTQDLTKAILDFSAGMGLGNSEMDRIIYNFAQMRAAGKVTGTEMRDLARGAFFPLTEVLDVAARKLGISAQGLTEFRKAAAEGAIDIETFFQAFIEVAGRNFPDAASKMNNTFKAVKDNLQDLFKTLLGWNTFGPAIAAVSEVIANGLKSLTAPGIADAFYLLGQAMLYLFNSFMKFGREVGIGVRLVFNELGIRLPTLQQVIMKVVEAVTFLGAVFDTLGSKLYGFIRGFVIPFVQQFKSGLADPLADIANDAFTWGANIIVNLAEGIIRGAAAALEAAMNFVSNLFRTWLAPGSPPKVAPNLPQWGAKAMGEYLRGFSMADFSMLDSVQNALKGSLDALVNLGGLGKQAGSKLFVNLSKDMIKAIANFNKTGKMSKDIFEKLSKVGGGFGRELADLLRKQVALAAATEKAAAAEKALKDAQEATKNATSNVNRLVKEYNAMLRAGADRKTLKMKLSAVNAAEMELDMARKREKEAEIANEQAQKALDPLKEAVKLQEQLIQQLIELARAQAEANKAADGGGGDGGTGGIKPPDFDFDGLGDSVTDGLNDLFDLIRKQMLEKLGGIWDDLKKKWDEKVGPILEKLEKTWNKFTETLRAIWDEVVKKIGIIWGNLRRFWEENGPRIMEISGRIAGTIVGTLGGLALNVLRWFLDAWVKISNWMVANGPTITKTLDNIANVFDWLGQRITASWPTIQSTLNLLLDLILNLGAVILAVSAGDWSRAWEMMKQTAVQLARDIAVLAIEYLENTLDLFGIHVDLTLAGIWATGERWGTQIRTQWETLWTEIQTKVNETWDAIKLKIDTTLTTTFAKMGLDLEEMKARWNQIWEDVKLIVTTIWDRIREHIETRVGESKTAVETKIGEIQALWNAKWGEIKAELERIWLAIIDTVITPKTQEVYDKVTGKIEEARKWISEQVENWKTVASNLIQGLIDGIAKKAGEFISSVTTAIEDAIEAAKKALDMKSPSGVFKSIGENMMQGLIDGVLTKIPAVAAAIVKAIKAGIAAALGALLAGSPSKVYQSIGENMMASMALGVAQASRLPQMAVAQATQATVVPAQQVLRQSSVSFGDTIINNSLDGELFVARVRQVVRGEL